MISSSVYANKFSSVGSPGSILLSIPSKPASSNTANARYGLHDGSADLHSILVPNPRDAGILNNVDLFLNP